jgi:hypothetical protein
MMGVYHQMGHDSWNLIEEQALDEYQGIILSPVNDSPQDVIGRLEQLGFTRNRLEIILDPQFYKPRSDRGQLTSWSYFGNDVDTADLGSIEWWGLRGEALVHAAKGIGATAICSPAMLPRVFDDSYYSLAVNCANRLFPIAQEAGLGLLLTGVVQLQELGKEKAPQRIASILTRTNVSRLYLVLLDDLTPRQQRTDYEALAGAIKLIRLLEDAGTKVLVGFSGLDGILWKHAGATDLATGKYFNLRRFVPGRWEEAADGGRVVPYWTDGGLVTWLREPDVQLLLQANLIDRDASNANPYSRAILEILDSKSGKAWLALGWRQYLHWFQEMECAIGLQPEIANETLRLADDRWKKISDSKIYLFDRGNEGQWIRPWMNAITRATKR